MAELEFFTVTYDAVGVTRDGPEDPDITPDVRPMTANVEFIYRIPEGYAFRAPTLGPRPTDVGFGGFVCRVDEGQLKHLAGTVGFTLPANTPVLGWNRDLYIDVVFTNVVYARGRRTWNNFAFVAPTVGGGTVNLTTVQRHQFMPKSRYNEWFQRHPIR